MMKRIFLMSVLILGAIPAYAQDVAPAPVAGDPIPMGISSPATGVETPAAPAEAAPPVEGAVPAESAATTPEGTPVTPVAGAPMEINPNDIPSVLFTYWEHTAIADAKRSRGLERPVTDEELMRDLKTRETHKVKPPPEEREIALSGIVYVKAGEWTIWLNGKRITPKAIPKEIMDLKVYKEYVEFKWFDDYTNQIFPLRMRPHQRFNIDTRIFLPG